MVMEKNGYCHHLIYILLYKYINLVDGKERV